MNSIIQFLAIIWALILSELLEHIMLKISNLALTPCSVFSVPLQQALVRTLATTTTLHLAHYLFIPNSLVVLLNFKRNSQQYFTHGNTAGVISSEGEGGRDRGKIRRMKIRKSHWSVDVFFSRGFCLPLIAFVVRISSLSPFLEDRCYVPRHYSLPLIG